MSKATAIGPNVKRLIVARMALLAIPLGSGDRSFGLGIDALITPGKTAAIYRQAADWAKTTIQAMRDAADCPWANDEEIAADILKNLTNQGLL